MPIDTPYNRMVTEKYNQILRDKVDHEEATLQTVMPSPAGMYVNGYEPVMVGSGVGLYKKNRICPKGHKVCSCDDGLSGSGKAHGISATLCGRGECDRVVGGNNLGLEPNVRVALALGAGMRGDATSKHGCLDMYEKFNNGPKLTDGTLYHKSIGGLTGQQHHRHRHLASENVNKNKALRMLGNGEGGRRGRKNPLSSKPPANQGRKGQAPPPKKEEPSIYTLENLEKGVNAVEKVGNVIGKVTPMFEGAYNYGKKFFGGRPHENMVKQMRESKRKTEERKAREGKGKAHGATKTIRNEDRHAERVRGVRASGKAHGKTRCEIVREVMNKMGCSMIEASKHVKANGLY